MMNRFASLGLAILAASLLGGCPVEPEPEPDPAPVADVPLDPAVISALSMERVRADVDLLADDAWAGRIPGSPGHAAAADWLAVEMAESGLEPLNGGYEVAHTLDLQRDRWMLDASGAVVEALKGEVEGRQFVGLLPGTDPDLADEYIVLMAHYDHIGVTAGGSVFNGAFDDAVAVASLLEFASVLVDQGVAFRRSLLFLITDAEEAGLLGSEAWVADPTVPLGEIALALSIDPLGRPLVGDYAPLAVLGAERCADGRALWRRVRELTGVPIVPINREPVLVWGADQDSFWAHPDPVPAVWLASTGMTWYHTTSDTPESIDYRTVRDHLEAIATGIALYADADDRCVDLGAQPVDMDDVVEALASVDALVATGELTNAELLELIAFRDIFQDAVDAGEVDASTRGAYLQMLVFMIQELAPAHPGPVPPPFPE